MERAAAAPVAMLIARGACGLPEPCLMAPIRARGGGQGLRAGINIFWKDGC
jgi:hypothetical protein